MSAVAAIVPAKATSRRFPGKNLAHLGGIPLVERKITQLKHASGIGSVYVATDSEEISAIAITHGCEVLWRQPEWADDEKGKSFSDTIVHLAQRVPDEHIFWAQCTAPFIGPRIVDYSVERYWQAISDGFDSLISHTVVSDYLWSSNQPMNYKPGPNHVRSQDLHGITRMTFGATIAPRESMVSWRYHHGPNPHIVLVDKIAGIDIDDHVDFQIADHLSSSFEEGSILEVQGGDN